MKIFDKIIGCFLSLIFISLLRMFCTPGVIFVRRRVGKAFKAECVVPAVKHGGGSIMIWVCMTDSGIGQLLVCEERMNSTKYINVLESALFLSFWRYQHECGSFPARQRAMSQICSHYDMVQRKLYWTSGLACPIIRTEPHWTFMGFTEDQNQASHNKEELKRCLRLEWNAITPEECRNLVNSVPKRISAVIKSKGGPTKCWWFFNK